MDYIADFIDHFISIKNGISFAVTYEEDNMIEMNKHKTKNSGFTIIELVIVLAIISILAVMTLPNLGGMIEEYRLRSATRELIAALQNLKVKALKENAECKLLIELDSGVYKYSSFVDADDDNSIDAGELFKETILHNKLTLSQNIDDVFGFTNRGMPSNNPGTIILELTGGREAKVVVNFAGNIRVD